MPKFTQHTVSTLLLAVGRIFLGGVFIWASWDKILAPQAFAKAIANYQIVPMYLADWSALLLPWIELVCGVCLITNRWARGSALIAAGLMIVFMAALGYNMIRGIDVSCGCFTLDEKVPGNMWGYLARDAAFLALAVTVMRRPQPAANPFRTD